MLPEPTLRSTVCAKFAFAVTWTSSWPLYSVNVFSRSAVGDNPHANDSRVSFEASATSLLAPPVAAVVAGLPKIQLKAPLSNANAIVGRFDSHREITKQKLTAVNLGSKSAHIGFMTNEGNESENTVYSLSGLTGIRMHLSAPSWLSGPCVGALRIDLPLNWPKQKLLLANSHPPPSFAICVFAAFKRGNNTSANQEFSNPSCFVSSSTASMVPLTASRQPGWPYG
mmetsp:Transcript_2743/g.3918  ORF Transcript_2743/g.3918 Transcript_2743/m.3918 type:complete len:226 (+) Transcript_2743:1266-1943(+)